MTAAPTDRRGRGWKLLLRIGVVALSLGPTWSNSAPAQEGSPARVLLLGDSISIGYTPYVQEALRESALVLRPTQRDPETGEERAENCAGTTYGVERIEDWLRIGVGEWDVIHFNFGLHDIKRVDPKTGKNSQNPTDPHQADGAAYEGQLREIVGKLKATGARLIFATTTPVPEGGVRPHRDVQDVERYNAVARRIMSENGISINDLYGFALPRLGKIQRPVNVHFTPEGSRQLAQQVVRHLRSLLPQ